MYLYAGFHKFHDAIAAADHGLGRVLVLVIVCRHGQLPSETIFVLELCIIYDTSIIYY